MRKFLLIIPVILALVYFFPFASSDKAKEATEAYQRGELAKEIGPREDAFNEALKLYNELEEKYEPLFGNGKLYYNIANTYFQLGEVPFAILYYNKALKLMPRNEVVKNNLYTALDKLGLEKNPSETMMLSIPERLQLFSLVTLLGLACSIIFVWIERPFFKKISGFFYLLAFALLLSLGYSQYIAPLEGVIVKSSPLYRDAGYQYTQVQENPLLSGEKVEVIDALDGGLWLKVLTPQGKLGYVPYEALRVI